MKTQQTDSKWYDLRNAVWERDFNNAENLLKEHPELITMLNSIGETVLHFLAVENDLEGVKWLNERGFSLDVKNCFSEPAIFEVAQLDYSDLLRWFIERGADIRITNREGENLCTFLKRKGHDDMLRIVKKYI